MKLDKETLECLRHNAINANEIPIDDEIMQDDKWDEIYEMKVSEV